LESMLSAKVSEFMEYGTKNEPNAMVTLTGKVLPTMFQNLICCEEGFVEIGKTKDNNPFMVVSPDGSIRRDTTLERTELSVELKCPVMDIHKTIPTRYYLQCQAEIIALGVDSLVYLCWKSDFSSVFVVQRDDTVFASAYGFAEKFYKSEAPMLFKSVKQDVKQLKQDVVKACGDDTKVRLVGLFPSLEHDENMINQFESQSLFKARVELKLNQIIKAIERKFELFREKATEAVVFLCSTLDRSINTKSVTAPVCWLTKGYSLDWNTMRRIAEHVLNVCHDAEIHIPAISFDG
jgi:hypothetical protein